MTRSLFSLSTDGWLMSLRSAFIVNLVGHLYWDFVSADTPYSHSILAESMHRKMWPTEYSLAYFRTIVSTCSAWRKRRNQSRTLTVSVRKCVLSSNVLFLDSSYEFSRSRSRVPRFGKLHRRNSNYIIYICVLFTNFTKISLILYKSENVRNKLQLLFSLY